MDPNDDEVWEGLEELVTLPKLTDQENVPVALGVLEVTEVDHQNPDPFLAIGPIDCYCFGQLQLQQDLFIHRQEERILGCVADSANEMDTKVSQSTSYGSSPIERTRKEQCRAEKRKQSSVASTSKSKRKKLTPEEEEEEEDEQWANTLFNDDKYGRIDVGVEMRKKLTIDVMVPSELSTIAEIKREISGYFLTVNGDDVGVERMVLSSVHAPTEIVYHDHLTLRQMNTKKFKLRLLPQ